MLLVNESGMTLLEILIAVVITTIVMTASYVTYNLVSKQYSSIADRASMRQAGRKAMDMMIKDLRNVGYAHEESNCPKITRPIYSINSNSGPDNLEIIYDVSSSERRKVIYEVENKKLYKKVNNDNGGTCNPNFALYTNEEDKLLIKNVEDLQFEGMKANIIHEVCGADSVNIFLTVKSNKEHGKERNFSLDQNANSNLIKNIKDKYLRETFTTTVLLRNIFHGGASCT